MAVWGWFYEVSQKENFKWACASTQQFAQNDTKVSLNGIAGVVLSMWAGPALTHLV